MLAEGVLDAAGRRPDAAWALHVFSAQGPPGVLGSRPGPLMAASNELHVTVRGRGGHGSAPHRAADPVPATCEMVLGLQAVVTRSISPFAPSVLTVGQLSAGTAANVIPDTASFSATVRCFDPVVLGRLENDTRPVLPRVAAAHGLEVDVDFERSYPVTVNDAGAVDVAEQVVPAALGAPRFARMPDPVTGSEDFSRVLQAVPGAMLFLGACPPDRDWRTAPDNHSPRAAFDDAALPDAAAVLTGLALATLGDPSALHG